MDPADLPEAWRPVPDSDFSAIGDDLELLDAVATWDPMAALDKSPTAPDAAKLLAEVLRARKALGAAAEDLSRFLGGVLPYGQQHVFDGLPAFQLRGGSKRTEWDHVETRRDTQKAIAEKLSMAVIDVEAVLDEWSAVSGYAWKVTGLKALGLDPDEYCRKSTGPPSVQFAD